MCRQSVFLTIDGQGDPNTSQAFAEAVEALYAVAYALKFMVKKGPLAIDYGVMPLEGLWWADDMAAFSVADKSNWQWTLMIMQPDFVTGEMVADAIAEVKRRRTPPLDRTAFYPCSRRQMRPNSAYRTFYGRRTLMVEKFISSSIAEVAGVGSTMKTT